MLHLPKPPYCSMTNRMNFRLARMIAAAEHLRAGEDCDTAARLANMDVEAVQQIKIDLERDPSAFPNPEPVVREPVSRLTPEMRARRELGVKFLSEGDRPLRAAARANISYTTLRKAALRAGVWHRRRGGAES